jgi:N-acetyl-anhydromuramyl-L-alanine amidase AmpD
MSTVKNLTAWLASHTRKRACSTVVYHATAGGNLSGALSTLKAKGFSYHVLIDKEGVIWKAVPYTRVAYHAGKSIGPEGANVNDYSIGICFVNRNDGLDALADAQLNAAKEYTLELKEVFPGLRWGCTHFGVSWGRKTDPKLFDLRSFCAEVGLEAWKLPKATWRLF